MNLGDSFLDLCYRINGNDKRYKYYKAFRKNLTYTRDEILELQQKSIKNLINHAYHNSVYYKRLFDQNGINPAEIINSKDLMKIPPLTKSIIVENFEDIKTTDFYGKDLKKVTSGGSTGIQVAVYKSPYFEQMSRAAWLRNNSMIGWMPSNKSVWIWGSPIEHATLKNSIKARIGAFFNKKIILNAYKYSQNDFPKWYKLICSFKPKVLYGYASILLEFANFILENKLVFSSIKMVVSSCDKLLERETIAKAFNCNVYDQYGCREIVAIGIETKPTEMVFTDDTTIVNTNENDEFLLTSLHSYGFPLINYKVGDIGMINSTTESYDKYPFPKINLKIGRITDNFLTENNKIVSTSALSTYFSTLMLGIRQHQIIQSDFNDFIINYIPMDNTDHDFYKKRLAMALMEYFGKEIKTTFNVTQEIPFEKSGKRLQFKRTFNQM